MWQRLLASCVAQTSSRRDLLLVVLVCACCFLSGFLTSRITGGATGSVGDHDNVAYGRGYVRDLRGVIAGAHTHNATASLRAARLEQLEEFDGRPDFSSSATSLVDVEAASAAVGGTPASRREAAAAGEADLDALRALTGADAPAAEAAAADGSASAGATGQGQEEEGLDSMPVPEGYVMVVEDEEALEVVAASPTPSPSPQPLPAKKPPAAAKNLALPAYAESPFYNDAQYRCRPTGRLSFNIPAVEQQPPGEDGRQSWTLSYGRYDMAWPRMLRPEFSDWFRRYEINNWRANTGCNLKDGWLGFCEESYTRGRVSILRDVVVSDGPNGHDCGPNGSVDVLLDNARGVIESLMPAPPPPDAKDAEGLRRDQRAEVISKLPSYETVLWARIPATWTFQHWMENTLPKAGAVAHVDPTILRSTGITAVQELLLDRYPIIRDIHDHMGMGVVDDNRQPVHAGTLIYPCVTPPLHPYLWQIGQREILGVTPLPMEERTNLVYCGRTKGGRIENGGRRVLNEDDVVASLQRYATRVGLALVEFDHTRFKSIAHLIRFFSRAALLVGPHGGCLTNVNFMGCNSAVIELFPLVNGEHSPVGHPAMMMYMQSQFLEQHYYMLPVHTPDAEGNMVVPLDHLQQVLDDIAAVMAQDARADGY